ncbi:MAG: radical SAM protein [Halobacteriota archaeon]
MKCVLLVTESCNLRCKYCYISAGENNAPLAPTQHIMHIIDLLDTIGIKKLIIGGGEPLLREDIFDILDKATARMPTHLLTNGTLINEKTAKKMALSGIDGVSISLDSPMPKVHDELRDGSFTSVINGIKLCVKEGLNVDVAACVTTKNFDYALDLILFAENIGATSITFEGLNPVGRGKDCANLALTARQTDTFLQTIYEILHDIKPNIKVVVFDPQWVRWDRSAMGCEVGKTFFGLRSNGDILPCTNLPITLGNILEDDFSAIWNCEMMNALRTKRNGGCNTCQYRDRCGGCRSKAYAAGDIFGSDPSCSQAPEEEEVRQW